ncbi:hypothetical protein SADUNF_Sadunf07G0073800 [Salix dunnii]|uniref:Uncharacterized protein n=1 Tax=Salix dunnii TaxID=1413687 RepID=A0A835MVD7_9ROSI|nr:hypothetical protein SADUNF_Sadunf07G0073800 [Salix dunnii]
MFEHGDDLTIEGHRISWLIWIQILVFLLLFLFCFSFFPADLPDTTTTTSSSASPSTPGVFMPLNFHLENQILEQNDHHVSNRLQHTQVQQNQSIKGEITTSTGRRIVSEDNIGHSSDYICFHPCNYFRLAKLAFLKCFGLDFLSDDSLN